MEYEECEWKIDPEVYVLQFKTACGNHHHLIANDDINAKDPANNYKYCPFCGKKIARIIDAEFDEVKEKEE